MCIPKVVARPTSLFYTCIKRLMFSISPSLHHNFVFARFFFCWTLYTSLGSMFSMKRNSVQLLDETQRSKWNMLTFFAVAPQWTTITRRMTFSLYYLLSHLLMVFFSLSINPFFSIFLLSFSVFSSPVKSHLYCSDFFLSSIKICSLVSTVRLEEHRKKNWQSFLLWTTTDTVSYSNMNEQSCEFKWVVTGKSSNNLEWYPSFFSFYQEMENGYFTLNSIFNRFANGIGSAMWRRTE